MNEKEIENYIKKEAEGLPVPEALKPEHIEEKLGQTTPGKVKRFPHRRPLAVACSILLVVAAATGGYFLTGNAGRSDSVQIADNSAADGENDTTDEATVDSIRYEDAYASICSYYDGLNLEYEGSAIEEIEETEDLLTTGNASQSEKSVSDSSTASASGSDYTDTDTQVDGVMEGDLVKTDGSCIYSLSDETTGYGVTIYRAKETKVKKLSHIVIEGSSCEEMYLENDRLLLIETPWQNSTDSSDDSVRTSGATTQIRIYDVSDPASPKELRTQNQSGSYTTSRVAGTYLYTFSTWQVLSSPQKEKPETYIPQLNGKSVEEASVRQIDDNAYNTYLVMTALAVDGSSEYSDSICALGEADVYYVSSENIYATATTWQLDDSDSAIRDMTAIVKYGYDNGSFTYQGSKKIRGTINNSYCMHEQDGNLCLVYNRTKNYRLTNGLCVLDKDLKLIGEIRDLGQDERVYASYFMDKTAYFVTYRETDPVFAVDLSDPTKPTLKSELKLPGYSDYLHAFGSDHLLGIGISASDRVKLSLFSIGKNKKLRQQSKQVLNRYCFSNASVDRHSVFIDEDRMLIGLPVLRWSGGKTDYLLFSCDTETGEWTQLLKQKDVSANTRAVRIGDFFYVVDDESGVTCYAFPTCGTPDEMGKTDFAEK